MEATDFANRDDLAEFRPLNRAKTNRGRKRAVGTVKKSITWRRTEFWRRTAIALSEIGVARSIIVYSPLR